MPKIQLITELEFKVLDKNGKLDFYLKKPLESFVLAHIQWINRSHRVAINSIKDTTNVSRNVVTTVDFQAIGPADQSLYGVVVGTGTNPVTISDYALQTQTVHGIAADQLSHGATAVNTVQVVPPSALYTITRTFTNLSGATITVKEAGLYVKSSATTNYFCIIRDLTGDIPIADTNNLQATYTIGITL